MIRLGDDMISTQGSAEVIDAPLVFEAGHLFKRDGKYYYSYSSNFGFGGPIDPNGPPTGAIAYLMADSPMGPWTPETYKGVIFRNPGTYFGAGGNNHQSVFKLGDQYYFTYHAQTLNSRITGGATQGFRSPHLAKLDFNADGTIKEVRGDYKGVEQIRDLDPYRVIEAETIAWQQGIATKKIDGGSEEFGAQAPNLVVHDIDNGDWTSLAKVDFGAEGATGVTAKVRPLATGGKIEEFASTAAPRPWSRPFPSTRRSASGRSRPPGSTASPACTTSTSRTPGPTARTSSRSTPGRSRPPPRRRSP